MPQPNIVLILVDDMGYGDFGVFNDGSSSTPTLDALAAEGLCLSQHYAGSAVCAPSRAALMTGRYPHRAGAIDTLEGRGLDRLALRERTMADYFHAAGYATGLVGKWHLGALDPRYHPNARGFDEFIGFRGGWQDYYDWRLCYNQDFRKGDGQYLTDVFSAEAAGFIRRHRQEPFFLHVTYNAPHFPLQAPASEVAPFREKGFTGGVSAIYGMIHRMDTGVARILDELAKCGIADNTIVLFTSDNGPQTGGEGDNCTTRFNCHYNGAKGSVLEGGIRVPMILRWPAGLPSGQRRDDMVHFTDWLPTLMSAAGCELPYEPALDGVNVLPMLQGESGKVCTRRFWQWNRYTPEVTSNAAMRDGDWKLVRPALGETMFITQYDGEMDSALKYQPETITDICRDPEPERTLPTPPPAQLYNIGADPLEQHDLASSEPERAAKMLGELETWFEEVDTERRGIEDD